MVDDSSTDSSRDIAQRYVEAHDNFNLFCLEKNCGPGSARNIGARHAHGQYLAFFDADDWCDNVGLAQLKDVIKQHNYPDILLTGYSKYDDGRYLKNFKYHDNYIGIHSGVAAVELRLQKIICPSPWNKLYKTSYWQRNKLSWPALRHSEDFASILEFLAAAETVLITNRSYYCYNINPFSLTMILGVDKIDKVMAALEYLRSQSKSFDQLNMIENIDNKLNRLCYAHVRHFLRINADTITRDALSDLITRMMQFNLHYAVPFSFFMKEFDGYKLLILLRKIQSRRKLAIDILQNYTVTQRLRINAFLMSPIKLGAWKKPRK